MNNKSLVTTNNNNSISTGFTLSDEQREILLNAHFETETEESEQSYMRPQNIRGPPALEGVIISLGKVRTTEYVDPEKGTKKTFTSLSMSILITEVVQPTTKLPPGVKINSDSITIPVSPPKKVPKKVTKNDQEDNTSQICEYLINTMEKEYEMRIGETHWVSLEPAPAQGAISKGDRVIINSISCEPYFLVDKQDPNLISIELPRKIKSVEKIGDISQEIFALHLFEANVPSSLIGPKRYKTHFYKNPNGVELSELRLEKSIFTIKVDPFFDKTNNKSSTDYFTLTSIECQTDPGSYTYPNSDPRKKLDPTVKVKPSASFGIKVTQVRGSDMKTIERTKLHISIYEEMCEDLIGNSNIEDWKHIAPILLSRLPFYFIGRQNDVKTEFYSDTGNVSNRSVSPLLIYADMMRFLKKTAIPISYPIAKALFSKSGSREVSGSKVWLNMNNPLDSNKNFRDKKNSFYIVFNAPKLHEDLPPLSTLEGDFIVQTLLPKQLSKIPQSKPEKFDDAVERLVSSLKYIGFNGNKTYQVFSVKPDEEIELIKNSVKNDSIECMFNAIKRLSDIRETPQPLLLDNRTESNSLDIQSLDSERLSQKELNESNGQIVDDFTFDENDFNASPHSNNGNITDPQSEEDISIRKPKSSKSSMEKKKHSGTEKSKKKQKREEGY